MVLIKSTESIRLNFRMSTSVLYALDYPRLPIIFGYFLYVPVYSETRANTCTLSGIVYVSIQIYPGGWYSFIQYVGASCTNWWMNRMYPASWVLMYSAGVQVNNPIVYFSCRHCSTTELQSRRDLFLYYFYCLGQNTVFSYLKALSRRHDHYCVHECISHSHVRLIPPLLDSFRVAFFFFFFLKQLPLRRTV